MLSQRFTAAFFILTFVTQACSADRPALISHSPSRSGDAAPTADQPEKYGSTVSSDSAGNMQDSDTSSPSSSPSPLPASTPATPTTNTSPVQMPTSTVIQAPISTPSPILDAEALAIKKKCTPQVEFESNGSAGAQKFLKHVPDPKLAMVQAAHYICSVLYKKASEVPSVTKVTLILDTHGGVAQAGGSLDDKVLQIDTDYINGLDGDVKLELDGVLIHENTHIWQWSGQGVDGGFIEGIADFVRAGGAWYPSASRNSKGGRYNDAYTTSAYFIGWVNSKYPDFAYKFNLAQKKWPGVSLFKSETGIEVNALWTKYQNEGTFMPKNPDWVAKQVPLKLGL